MTISQTIRERIKQTNARFHSNYHNLIREQQSILIRDYLSCDIMMDKLLYTEVH